jgi:nitrogen fixation protein NifX
MSATDTRLIDVRMTDGDIETDDKNKFRAQLIKDCHVLYVVSIGGPAAAKVVRADIHPIKIPQGGKAREVLEKLKDVLSSAPPPWLAKAMGMGAEERARIQSA